MSSNHVAAMSRIFNPVGVGTLASPQHLWGREITGLSHLIDDSQLGQEKDTKFKPSGTECRFNRVKGPEKLLCLHRVVWERHQPIIPIVAHPQISPPAVSRPGL